MPKKSIFRQPGAQHFQLVHRSQRDPLVHDPDAPQRLFKEVARFNDKGKTGQTLAELETQLLPSTSSLKNPPVRPNEGEATLYGVYYDDTEYDYMQHLRGVDDSRFRPVDNGAVFVSAPGRGSTAVGNTGAAGRSTVQSTHEGVKLFNKGKARAMEDEGEGEFTEMFSKNKHGLPVSVLPSGKEISWQQAQESTRAVPTSLTGFQPDMDPHLRQVLEALEDDAFVSNELDEEEEETDEGWFDELLGGGERGEEEPDLEEEFEFREEGIEPDGTPSWGPNAPKSKTSPTDGTTGTLNDPSQSQEGETWEDRFRAFKASGALAAARSSAALEPNHPLEDEDERSEAADTLASLRSAAPTVLGAKKRRRAGGSQASGYSMSSSSMFRNKGLTVLDEMFDKIERDYEEGGEFDDDDFPESEWQSEAGSVHPDNQSETGSMASFTSGTTFTRMLRKQQAAQQNGESEVSREDFEAIMDDFLDNYEVVGKKMVPVLPGQSGAEKLESMRRALVGLDLEGNGPSSDSEDVGSLAGGTKRESQYIRERYLRDDYKVGGKEEEMPVLHIIGQNKEDKWDAETILSTYSNLENHPRVIGAVKKSKKKGPGSVVSTSTAASSAAPSLISESSVSIDSEPPLSDYAPSTVAGDDDDDDNESISSDGTITLSRPPPVRPKGESKEERKARKLGVKAERSARRQEKKTRQETFAGERKGLLKSRERAVGAGRASDLTALASGGQGTINVVRL